MEYEKLLERAKKNLPEKADAKERFEMPKVKGHIEGNKTIITNFNQIAVTLRRDAKHMLKYLLRELATPGTIDGQRLTLGRKINSTIINNKLQKYANEFVICKDCKRPDTQIMKEGKVTVLKCTACGAKHPIKSKI
ncbi:translation initiation factor IF-2 subunit beta [Candidatus Woesearchaeota archaeon]|jgi:translation initiation factor 2 subunit 2|nr:translation initiation factor IF-2 subunit beta [Candidatus Woesearchaeota archaeon]MBT7237250.1 translation initiation factor IF-2 subunit beta [Candidatus Woesearchaeota archaeon]